MGSKKAKQKVFRYFMGLHFGLCHGPVDRFLRFIVGDREAWAGNASGNETIAVSAPNLFGGTSGEGGIDGKLTVMMGGPAQALPGNVLAALPAQAPAFRGVLSLFYDGLISVNNPYVKPMAFQVERIKAGWAGAGCWYASRAAVPLSEGGSTFGDTVFAVASGAGNNTHTPELYHYPYTSESIASVADDELYFDEWQVAIGFQNRTGIVESSDDFDIEYGQDFAIEFEWFVHDTGRGGVVEGHAPFSRSFVDVDDYNGGNYAIRIWAFQIEQSKLFFYCQAIGGYVECPLTLEAWTKYRVERIGTTLSLYKNGALVASNPCTLAAINGPCPISINGLYMTYSALPYPWRQGSTNRYRNLRIMKASTVPGLSAMNPAHIIYQCLTDPQWGMGYPTAAIDGTSFTAAADTLYAEGLGLCMLWNTSDEIGAFVGKVLDHAGGVLYTEPQTGRFKLTLLRADYDAATLPVFDESNIVALESFQRVGYGDTVNEIVVVYRDVVTNKDASVTVQNLANIQAQGGVVSQARQYPGLPNEALALRVAQRDLDASSIALAKARIKVNRKGWNRTPGSCLKLTWPKLGIAGVVMRVLDIDTGTLEDGTITINCAEDVFGLPASTYAEQEPAGWVAPSTDPAPITRQAMMEAPYYLLAHNLPESELAALDADASYFSALAVRPTTLSLDFALQSRVGAAPYAQTGSGRFVPGAELAGALERAATSTIALANAADLDRVSAGMLAVVGAGRTAEIMQVLTVDAGTSTITVNRAVLDTTPQAHAAGASVFVIAGDGDVAGDTVERATAEEIDYRLLPQTTGAQLEAGLATSMTVAADQRQARPLAPGNLQINGVMFPASVLGAITVSWAHRNRLQQTEGIVLQTDSSVAPEAGTSYTVSVYDEETAAQVVAVTGITDTSRALVVPTGSLLRVEVAAVRAGLESWQRQVRRFVHADGVLLLETGDGLKAEQGQLVSQESAPPDTSGFTHRATFVLSGAHSANDRLQFALQFSGSSVYVIASAAGTSTLAEFAAVIAQQFIAQGRDATVDGESVHVHSSAAILGASVVSLWARYPVTYVAQASAAAAVGGPQWTFVDLYSNDAFVATCPSPSPALASGGIAQASIDVHKRMRGAAPITGGHAFTGGGAARRFYFAWPTNAVFSDYLHQIEGLVTAINDDVDLAANGITASLGSLSAPPVPDTPMTRSAVKITATGNYGVNVNGQFTGGFNGKPINPWPIVGASHPSGFALGIAQWADMGPALPSGLPQISAFDPRPGAGYGFEAGQQWWLVINGTEYHYTLSGSESSGADVAAGLAALVDPGGGWTVESESGEALVKAATSGAPFACRVWASYGIKVAVSLAPQPSLVWSRIAVAGRGRLLVRTMNDAMPNLVSSDDGASYVAIPGGSIAAYDSRPENMGAALPDGSYISMYFNEYAGLAGHITGNLWRLPASVDSRINSPVSEGWRDYGYPRTTAGDVIAPYGVAALDGYFYAVGPYASSSKPAGLRLWRATAPGLGFAEVGAMLPDPADPNAIPEPSALSWDHLMGRHELEVRLRKLRGRWWLVHRYAIFYTDDADGLVGWRRAPTQFEIGMVSPELLVIRDVVEVGTSLVAMRGDIPVSGPNLAVSTDNGDTWTTRKPAFFGMTDTMAARFVSFRGELLIYGPFAAGGAYCVGRAGEPFDDWQLVPLSGIPAGHSLVDVIVSGGRIVVTTSAGALLYSDDGAHFALASIA